MEQWKDIKGYEGFYRVSNMGNVLSVNFRGNPKISKVLSNGCNSHGYFLVCLSKNGKHKTSSVHSLVANAFIENKANKPFINHINGIKSDNRAENLEWCTHVENCLHAYKIGLQKPPMSGKFGGEHGAAKIVLDTQTGIYYLSKIEAARAKNTNKCALSLKLNGKRKNNTSLIYV